VNIREPGFGPRPGVRRRPRELSKAQLRVLNSLEAEPIAVTLSELSARTGLHPNTLRDHLDALERAGLVQRRQDTPRGRGRPRILFEVTEPTSAEGPSEYAGLASALAATIHRTSADPRRDATAAGEQWGRELAADRPHPARPGPAKARREVVALLDDIGFSPEPDRTHATVRLTRCPLLETAQRYPDVVCAVHLGIVRGALAELGGDPEPAELFPFSDPGACRLHLGGRR
jgi:predicted ArsR family transcriptional regulator